MSWSGYLLEVDENICVIAYKSNPVYLYIFYYCITSFSFTKIDTMTDREKGEKLKSEN